MEDDTSKTVEFEYIGTKTHSGCLKWIPVHPVMIHMQITLNLSVQNKEDLKIFQPIGETHTIVGEGVCCPLYKGHQ